MQDFALLTPELASGIISPNIIQYFKKQIVPNNSEKQNISEKKSTY